MKKSSPSSVSLAKSSNIWKRWEIFPISWGIAGSTMPSPSPAQEPPSPGKKPTLCVCSLYLAHRPNPNFSLFQLLLQNQKSVAYRIESGETVLVSQYVGQFPTAPVPISHKPITAGAGHICKGTPGCDGTHQCWLDQPAFDFWIPSSSGHRCGEKGCARLPSCSRAVPCLAALTQLLCPTGLSPGKVLALLTLLPIAECIPGLAQVASGAIVHNAHMAGPTAGVGVGCGVSSCAIVQPTHQAQMESHLENQLLD